MRSIKALLLVLILSVLTTSSLFAGKVERLIYQGSGTTVADLTSLVNGAGTFPTNFDAVYFFVDSFDFSSPFPVRFLKDSLDQFQMPTYGNGVTPPAGDFLNNYGAFVRGYLEAPQTGSYTFWIASDDNSELWLSTDHLAANKAKIAFNNGAVGYQNYGAKITQRSARISLTKGNKYYFEVLMKEGGGGDHFSVGWQLPDGTLNRPISGIYLANYKDSFKGGVVAGGEAAPGRSVFTYTVPLFSDPTNTFVGDGKPQGTNVVEGTDTTLVATLDGSQPIAYHWYRTNTSPANLIPGAILSSLTLKNVQFANAGTYIVTVTNSFGGKTASAVVSVIADTVKPTLVSANAFGRLNGVTIVYSEPVDSVTALNTNNYYITNVVQGTSFKVLGASFPFANDFRTVDLLTETFTVQGDNYSVVVTGVKDLAKVPNTIVAKSSFDFPSVFGDGLLTWRKFNGIGNTDIASLTNNAAFRNNTPNTTQNLNIFESGINIDDNYGVQFVGFIIPKTNGNYTFAIASDDNSHLFLSSDENPANKRIIAAEPGWSNTREWLNSSGGNGQRTTPGNGLYSQYSNTWGNVTSSDPLANTLNTGPGTQINISKPQALLANRRYYIEYLGKEGGGGDDFAVTWVVPSAPPPATPVPPLAQGQAPISGAFLSTTGAVGGAAISITSQPVNYTTNDAKVARFTVGLAGAGPILVQWFRGDYLTNAAMADSTAATLVTPIVSAIDDQSTYFAIARNGFSSITSSIVTLTVIPDTTPPTLVNAKGSAFFNRITVAYSETLNETSATNINNYTISPSLTITRAILGPQRTNVVLFTSPQTPSTLFTVTVSGVKDASSNSNLIAAASSVQFSSFVPSRGFVMQEFYGNIGGTAVANLLSSGNYPDAPDTTTYLKQLATPQNIADNYGIRVSGNITAPFNEGWTFLVSSDDASGFYLAATTDPLTLNTNAIAYEGGCCRSFAATIDRGIQQFMQGGTPYYYQAIVKEGGGGDFLNVGWVGSANDPKYGDNGYIGGLGTIPATYLTAFADPVGATVGIVVGPVASVTVNELAGLPLDTVKVAATGAITGNLNPPISYIWQRKRVGDSVFTDLANASDVNFGTLSSAATYGQVGFNATNTSRTLDGRTPLLMTTADNGAQFR